ncbi:MAG: hypothetical protein DWI58_11785 [Chloroflexi bacterium]|nr:MAG: hypothetical protein DWI58_11785 [Chloroflexota bacterium]
MATTRSSRAADRRARQVTESRTERRIYLAVAVVGALVLAIIAAGVILTVVMPPRSTVVKVGDREFTARDLATRVKYAVLVEQNSALATNPAAGIPLLTREELLRQKASELGVSDVTDEEMTKELRKRLSLADDVPEAAFRSTYENYLKPFPLLREDFEAVVRVGLLRQKAADAFKAKVPESGLQLHLLSVTSPDRGKLEGLREAVAAGKPFEAEAIARGIGKEGQMDLLWVDPPSLPENLASIRDLKTNDLSAILPDERSGGFLLIQVAERAENRKYEDDVKTQIANRQLLEWVKQQEAALVSPSSLSGNSKSWVERQVRNAVSDATRKAQEAQQAAK